MSRTLRAYPGLLTAAAVALLVYAASTGELPGSSWRFAAVMVGITTAVIVHTRTRAPMMISAAIVAVGIQVSARTFGDGELAAIPWYVIGWDLFAGLAGALALVKLIRHRNGALRARDAVDLVAIACSIGLVAWLLIVNPLLADGSGLGHALLAASFLPTPLLFVTFTTDLLLSGLGRNRTVQLLVAASWVATGAAISRALSDLGVDSWTGGRALWAGGPVAAYLLLCAASSHRSAAEIVEPARADGEIRIDPPTRLTLTAPAVLVPLVLVAALAPRSDLDIAIRLIGTALLLAAVVARLYITMRDDRTARLQLYRQLHSDALTGLPSRPRFVEVVVAELERTWRTEAHPAIIKLNVDRFKQINDSLGHQNANEVLATIAHRIEVAAAEFGGFAARSGGDEFVVLDAEITSVDDAMERAAVIKGAIAPLVNVGDSSVFVTASIGVVVSPHHTIGAEDLMRRADIAAHQAKDFGGDQIALFDDSMEARLAERVDIEQALHGAVGRNELRLYYQPIVDIYNGEVRGFEALVRWERDGGRIISPGMFIPIAEETGLISEIGAWALHTALADLRRWINDGTVGPDTTMSVNVSPRQIADPGFADVVREALDVTRIPSRLLWIEMTESMMLQEPELAKTTLRATSDMGVRLALDDFGTGYSSLSLLQQFPIHRLKIDRAFVQGIADDQNDRSLVRTIIAMAQSMQLDMVAEGVETIQQLAGLRELGCDKAQGYLISRPVPVATMRSTMVALEELVSLPVFDSEHPDAVSHRMAQLDASSDRGAAASLARP